MEIKLIEDYDNKQKIARQILEALPDWFGIEEARENYIKESTEKALELLRFGGSELV